MANEKVIKVENLYKKYKDVVAVDHISFDVHGGEILGMLGPNGSGKTTTIKSILGLLCFDDGAIHVNGLNIGNNRRNILGNVGAVLEGARNVYWHLSPEENMKYFAGIKGFSVGEINDRMKFLLESLQLTDVGKKELRQLSKGMKQKVSLACAFIHDPEILLLDEPTLGLDVEISLTMKEWLRSIVRNENKTILITSHNMDFIESVCDRVLIIKKGSIISHETIDSLKIKFSKKAYVIDIDGSINESQKTAIESICELDVKTANGNQVLTVLMENTMQIYNLFDILKSENTELRDFRTVESDLEDIFLDIIRNEDLNEAG